MALAVKEKSLDELLSPGTTFLRPHQRTEWQREITHTDQLLERNAQSEKKFLQNAVRIRQQNERMKKGLADQTPRLISGEERDRLVALRGVLLERVQKGAPTRQEQYAKPNQVPVELKDKIRRWHTGAKSDLLKLKKIDLLLNPDSDDRNLTHTDKYLPNERQRDAYRSDRYGGFSLSPLAKANYDAINWDDPEVAAEIERLIAEGKVRVNLHAKPSEIIQRPEGDVEVKDDGDVMAVTVHRNDKKAALLQQRRENMARARTARTQKLAEKKLG